MKLTVQVRSATGKEVKKLRKEGILPAVVYGKSLETPVLLSCVKNDFIRVYRNAGYSTPIELTGGIDQLVLLQAMQLDPVSDEVLTVDFLAVNKNEKVSAAVPVVLIGESKVEKLNEGKVQLVKDTVEVEAFPQDLPHSIEVDLAKIETANDVIFVKDLSVSSKVTILDDGEQPVVTVVELTDEEETSEAATETPAA
ncbi:MAG: 50S ribosomal protein L25 [candidate division SR1 bacterium]|nr:MAG: 50S ribosomal protein L25 [candidate division SR1 bacterium]